MKFNKNQFKDRKEEEWRKRKGKWVGRKDDLIELTVIVPGSIRPTDSTERRDKFPFFPPLIFFLLLLSSFSSFPFFPLFPFLFFSLSFLPFSDPPLPPLPS